MKKYVFRMHFCSASVFKSGEGIEMEMRFVLKSDDYKKALQNATLWAEDLIRKNPSLRLMRQTLISLVSEENINENDTE